MVKADQHPEEPVSTSEVPNSQEVSIPPSGQTTHRKNEEDPSSATIQDKDTYSIMEEADETSESGSALVR